VNLPSNCKPKLVVDRLRSAAPMGAAALSERVRGDRVLQIVC